MLLNSKTVTAMQPSLAYRQCTRDSDATSTGWRWRWGELEACLLAAHLAPVHPHPLLILVGCPPEGGYLVGGVFTWVRGVILLDVEEEGKLQWPVQGGTEWYTIYYIPRTPNSTVRPTHTQPVRARVCVYMYTASSQISVLFSRLNRKCRWTVVSCLGKVSCCWLTSKLISWHGCWCTVASMIVGNCVHVTSRFVPNCPKIKREEAELMLWRCWEKLHRRPS